MALQTFESVHFFGIRHHGPGCARSLVEALEALQPDCILIEGPQEGESLLPWVGHEALKPPVALLAYAQDEPQLASFYPLAVFSPEWQAMLWANDHHVPMQLFDLPHTHKLALQKQQQIALEAQTEAENACDQTSEGVDDTTATEETITDEDDGDEGELAEDTAELFDLTDPLDALAQAAGYEDGETWWNRMVEERQDSHALFHAINEAMGAVREHMPHLHASTERQHTEMLREAWMRQRIRAAQKKGHERIAVVCGAWHVPALQDASHTVKADTQLLKGLPKLKIETTWAPWSYRHLAHSSGYAAGVASPGWYEHLWQQSLAPHAHDANAATERTVTWLTKVAMLFREQDWDCSSAHVIEATRLAEMLATMRHHATPGLEEINEAILTVMTMGESLPLQVIDEALNIGRHLGQVPEGIPMVPLQRDIQQQQQKLRLKPEASIKTLALDLRKELDLARSHFLHRLMLLGVGWATPTQNMQQNRGTFRESWRLAWQPEIDIDIIAANTYGTSLVHAAHNKVLGSLKRPETPLEAIAAALDQAILAQLASLVSDLTQLLQQRAAITNNMKQLLSTLLPLANIYRYGNVRQTDSQLLTGIIDSLVQRSSIGLNVACMGLDATGAEDMLNLMVNANQAIHLRQSPLMAKLWQEALHQVMLSELSAPMLRGLSCRLLLDAGVCDEATVSLQFSRNLSEAVPALEASQWLQGFLIDGQAIVLLHHEWILQAVDAWVCQLSHEHFVQVLPLIRRNFSALTQSERQSLAAKIQHSHSDAPPTAIPSATGTTINVAQASLMNPVLCQIFGFQQESLPS